MDFGQELSVAIKSGARVISVTTPERDRFYQHLNDFVLEESEKNGDQERMVLVSTNQNLVYFDWYEEVLRPPSESENESLKKIAIKLGTDAFSDKTISAYRNMQSNGNKTCLVIEDANYQLDNNKEVFLALRSFTDPKQNPHKDRVVFLLSESRLDLKELVNEVSELKLGYPLSLIHISEPTRRS